MRRSALVLAATSATMALAQNATSTATLYLPFSADNLAASVITAAPSATVYAIGCLEQAGACAANCSFDSSITITEGQSTLQYTWSNGYRAAVQTSGGSLIQDATTVQCALSGGSSVTEAVCTGISTVAGSNSSQTTTLGSSQISYYPVAITAGVGTNVTGTVSSSSASATGTASQTGSAGASSTTDTGAASATGTNGAAGLARAISCGWAMLVGIGVLALL